MSVVRRLYAGLVVVVAAGCTTVVSSITADLAEDLSAAILNNPDIEMVRAGAPAYLILMDGMLGESPKDVRMLMQASALNSAYASAFVTDPERSNLLQTKALSLAEQAVCLGVKNGCGLRERSFEAFEAWAAGLKYKHLELIYNLGTTWAGWIQANSDDYLAIAELGKVKVLMNRVAEIDSGYANGGVQLYLGVFETLVPPGLGGRPEVGRAHFEKAIEISGGGYLMSKVLFAEQYARLVFDRELHDALLGQVVGADPNVPGATLTNIVAQMRAKELLESADDYF